MTTTSNVFIAVEYFKLREEESSVVAGYPTMWVPTPASCMRAEIDRERAEELGLLVRVTGGDEAKARAQPYQCFYAAPCAGGLRRFDRKEKLDRRAGESSLQRHRA